MSLAERFDRTLSLIREARFRFEDSRARSIVAAESMTVRARSADGRAAVTLNGDFSVDRIDIDETDYEDADPDVLADAVLDAHRRAIHELRDAQTAAVIRGCLSTREEEGR